jgi:hypothetical protein
MRRAYLIYGFTVLGLWGAAALSGFELFAATRGKLPAEARTSPGGYRSYGYWRGGK